MIHWCFLKLSVGFLCSFEFFGLREVLHFHVGSWCWIFDYGRLSDWYTWSEGETWSWWRSNGCVMIRNKGLFWGSGENSIDVLHYLLKSSFKVSPPFKYLVCCDAQSFHFVSRIEELCTYSQSILYVSCIWRTYLYVFEICFKTMLASSCAFLPSQNHWCCWETFLSLAIMHHILDISIR